MNYIYHISSIATTFGPLSKVTILGQKCMAILGIRHMAFLIEVFENKIYNFMCCPFNIYQSANKHAT